MKRKWGVVIASMAIIALLVGCEEKKDKPKEPTPKEPSITKQTDEKKHESYQTYATEIQAVKESIDKYTDIQVAIDAGYRPAGPYVPGMGYHFINEEISMENPTNPNTLLYVLDEEGNFVLAGGEWTIMGEEQFKPVLFEGVEWAISTYAGGHYEDGSMWPSETQDVPQTHPDTGAKLVHWMPDVYGIHMYTHIENQAGAFSEFNEKITKEYDKHAQGKVVPPIEPYLPRTDSATNG